MLKEVKLFAGSKLIKEKEHFGNAYKLVNYLKDAELYPMFPVITGGVNEPVCEIDGEPFKIFCANNYLGMSENEAVKKAGIEAIRKYGMGPGGSRVISGNVDIIEELEREIAGLTGTEDCLTLPTGYMANVGVIRAVMDEFMMGLPYKKGSGAIFSDEYNHGSIVDGCKLSSAKTVVFKHDDLVDLENKLKEYKSTENKLIITEGVFSLDGEIINLPDYINLAKKYNAKIMIDDAHSIGILGKDGGGTPEHHNCVKDIDILMGCMDKAMGGTGGYLCGKKELIDYLRIATRSSILSSSLTCSMSGAMIESVKQIKKGQNLRKNLFEKSQYLRDKLKEKGFKIVGKDNIPSVALFVGDEKLGVEFANKLFERKFLSPIVRWPAVPEGQSRFRIIVMVTHTKEHLDAYINACEIIGKELKIIK